MGISETIKKALSKFIVSPVFLVLAALIVFSIGMLFGLGYLRYYVDGESINRRAIHSTLVLNLWEQPEFLKGELNLLRGNMEATVSEDGNTLILSRMFSRDNMDLFISERGEQGWSKPVALSGFINTGYDERGPSLSRDGNWLIFQSNRPSTRGGYDLYISQRTGDRWTEPVNLGETVNSEHDEGFATFSPDGKSIFFSSNRPKPLGAVVESEKQNLRPDGEADAADWDLYRSDVIMEGVPASETLPIFGDSHYLERVNSEWDEFHAAMPNGSDILYFSSDRPGGVGENDIWLSRFFQGEYIEPENLGKPVNSTMDEYYPTFYSRGSEMIFVSNVYSIHPRMLKYYSTQSRQVLSRFDYDLLRNVLLIVLLLVLAGLAIHYLLKLLLDSELKLLPRCLIASFLLHLILAALSGSLFLTSKIEERLEASLQEMTVNMNALAQESIAVAIRESIASLPQMQSPDMTQQVEVEIPLQTETPIQNRVNPYPDTVSVKQTSLNSERLTQVQQAQSTIPNASTASKVAKLSFSQSNLLMESPQGIIQSGEGDQTEPSDRQPEPQQETRRIADNVLEAPSYDPGDTTRGEISDVVTEAVQSASIAAASRSRSSGNLAQTIVKGVNSAMADNRSLEMAPSSPTSVAFDQAYGTLVFDADFVMEMLSEMDEEEEEDLFQRFLGNATGRLQTASRFGFDRRFEDVRIPAPDGSFEGKHELDRVRETRSRDPERSLSGVSSLLKTRMPGLTMEVDSELEIPEYMLEDLESEPVRPVF
ncbi:MAG: hypothetical protein ABQ298_05745 [Puniceicoccaceae bacterium]